MKKGEKIAKPINGLYSQCPMCSKGWLAEIIWDRDLKTWRPELLLFCSHLSHLAIVDDKPTFVLWKAERESPAVPSTQEERAEVSAVQAYIRNGYGVRAAIKAAGVSMRRARFDVLTKKKGGKS